MTTYPLAPSLTHSAREYAYVPVCGSSFSGVLIIRQDDETDVYALEEAGDGFTSSYLDECGRQREGAYFPPLACYPPTFLVRRCGGSDEGLYLVRLLALPLCDCYGFNRWQSCKHVDAISDCYKRGLLFPIPYASPPNGEPR